MLAIVIPYYKLTFFEQTLQSLCDQTDKRFTVYIGNDASPENPATLIKKFKKSVTIVYRTFETNLGSTSLVKQWDRCIKMVEAEEWIMVLGDDDVLGENVVEEFYKNLAEIENIGSSVIRYSTRVINENNINISQIYKHPKLETGTDFLIRKFKGGTRSSLSEYIFRKVKIETIKFKDLPLAWYSDLLSVVEFAEFKNIYTINEALLKFRLSGINITSKTDNLRLKNRATFSFYYYLLNQHGKTFPTELVQIIFNNLERTLLDNKKQIVGWIKLCYLYSLFFQWRRIISLSLKIKASIR